MRRPQTNGETYEVNDEIDEKQDREARRTRGARCHCAGCTVGVRIVVEGECVARREPSAIAAPTTAPATSTSAKTVVKTGTSPKLGAVLTDSNGMTLYTLTNAGAPVACTGQCLTVWPPLYLPAGTTTPTATAGVTGLSVSMQMGGTQVTQNGDPLYRFAHDTAPGDTNGEGIMAFGGVWHAAKTTSSTAAATTPATAAPVTTPTTAASTGGYGY